MSNHCVTVTIATPDHLFDAIVKTSGGRIFEVFNSTDSDFIRLESIKIRPLRDNASAVHLAECLVPKTKIILAIPTQGRHESPQKRLNAFVEKKQHATFLAVPGYHIAGTLHLKGAPDPLWAWTNELGGFVPVSDAVITSQLDCGKKLKVHTAIVNKAFISLFTIRENTSRTAVEPAPQVTRAEEPTDAIGQTLAELLAEIRCAQQRTVVNEPLAPVPH